MNHFGIMDGVLHAERVAIPEIAKTVGTPFYCYSSATIKRHFEVFSNAFSDISSMICYAVKANSNQAVLHLLAKLGAGADIVSGGELLRAKKAGIPAEKIVFSGIGKTAHELEMALNTEILCFNVESEPELNLLSDMAVSLGKTARVSFRVNPHVDAKTHEKISTGNTGDKFGIDWPYIREIYGRAKKLPGIKITGIDMHIGSQIESLEPFKKALGRLAKLVGELRCQGHTIEHIDVGGGLGIPYKNNDADEPPDPLQYASIIRQCLGPLNCQIILEPGRLIVGNAGILVGTVLFRKELKTKTILIGDVAMNDLVRPTLYQAWHEVYAVDAERTALPSIHGDLVGPVCETGDYIVLSRSLPSLKAGDLYTIGTAGAYGAVQSGTYNTRSLVPEVMVNGDKFHIIRPRLEAEDIIALDSVPDW